MRARHLPLLALLISFTIITAHVRAISGTNDVAALDIVSPETYSSGNKVIYPTGYPLRVEGRFKNTGTNVQRDVGVEYWIFNISGAPVQIGHDTVRGAWLPGQVRYVAFTGGFTPTMIGTYYIRVFIKLHNDINPTNDTAITTPLFGKPFLVYVAIEVAQMAGTTPGVSPMSGGTYPDGYPIMIRAAYSNSGVIAADSVPAMMVIRKGDCFSSGPVYYKTMMVPVITGTDSNAGSGPIVYLQFPDFIPWGPGTYCVTAQASEPYDPVHFNDTAYWSFTVLPRTLSVDDEEDDNEAAMLTVAPNPARGATTIGVRSPAAMRATLELYDASGTLAASLARNETMGARSFELNTADLASGIYTVSLVATDGTRLTRKLVVSK